MAIPKMKVANMHGVGIDEIAKLAAHTEKTYTRQTPTAVVMTLQGIPAVTIAKTLGCSRVSVWRYIHYSGRVAQHSPEWWLRPIGISSHTNIICMAKPAATAVLAYVVLGERMETMQIIGAIAVIVGVLILQLGPKALAKPPPSHRGAA